MLVGLKQLDFPGLWTKWACFTALSNFRLFYKCPAQVSVRTSGRANPDVYHILRKAKFPAVLWIRIRNYLIQIRIQAKRKSYKNKSFSFFAKYEKVQKILWNFHWKWHHLVVSYFGLLGIFLQFSSIFKIIDVGCGSGDGTLKVGTVSGLGINYSRDSQHWSLFVLLDGSWKIILYLSAGTIGTTRTTSRTQRMLLKQLTTTLLTLMRIRWAQITEVR